MDSNWNLPPGSSWRDVEGAKQDVCERCGEDFTDFKGTGICSDCEEYQELPE
jgi:hypothetical protein